MAEYIIESDKWQFYLEQSHKLPAPYGLVDREGVITLEVGGWGDITLTFEDEIRVLELPSRKVIFDSRDEVWERNK